MTRRWGPRGAAVAVIAAAIALEAVVAAQVRPGPPSGTARSLSNTGVIRGRVVDAQTEVGVARAEVQAVAAAINVTTRTRTDACGAYAFEGLAPGRYEVSAVVQRGGASARERAFFTISPTRAERGSP